MSRTRREASTDETPRSTDPVILAVLPKGAPSKDQVRSVDWVANHRDPHARKWDEAAGSWLMASLWKCGGSRYAAEYTVRAMYQKSQNGWSPARVRAFRDQIYQSVAQALECKHFIQKTASECKRSTQNIKRVNEMKEDESRPRKRARVAAEQEKDAPVQERVVKGCLTWKFCRGGGIYAVGLAAEHDAKDLANLENEFLEDHRKMVKEKGKALSSEDLAQIMGLQPTAEERSSLISAILRSHGTACAPAFTLKCAYLPRDKGSSAIPKVIGYLHVRVKNTHKGKAGQKEKAIPEVVISHLKVSKKFWKRGCAKMMAAAAVRQVELLLGSRVESSMSWRLAVVQSNKRAIGLYNRLGFKKVDMPNGGRMWLHMAFKREKRISAQSHAAEWLSKVPKGAEMVPAFSKISQLAPVRSPKKKPAAAAPQPAERRITRSMSRAMAIFGA